MEHITDLCNMDEFQNLMLRERRQTQENSIYSFDSIYMKLKTRYKKHTVMGITVVSSGVGSTNRKGAQGTSFDDANNHNSGNG